ncbi:MAG: hypothetical protein U0V87_12430 [Acidobacteriota bacterium]
MVTRAMVWSAVVLAVLLHQGCASPAPTSDWKPFNLGSYHRAVSTQSTAAQQAFDQGLIWSYAFNHDEAIRAFEEAQHQDPKLAMAAWGIALVNGPHINNPILDQEHARRAWDALQRARDLSGNATEVERALIEALGWRYAWPPPEDRAPLDARYAEAMADVHRRFPQDADVAALYAEALMDTRPWDQWTADGQPQPGTHEVLAALDVARQLSPTHPGALHLTVHALEASPHPELADSAATALRALVPDSSHLVHMPAHIDVRMGRWADAAAANERAIEADARYLERHPKIGFYALYMAHNQHFLSYTAMMEGRSAAAVEHAGAVVEGLSLEAVRANPLFLEAFLTVKLEAMKRFGMWQKILDDPSPPKDLPLITAYSHFARGVAFAALDKIADADHERALFVESLSKVPSGAYWGSNSASSVLAVALPYLDGEIAYRKQKLDEAVLQLTTAVRLEDGLKYDEPPPWTTPSRHALGAVLLAADRAAEAEAVYRDDLKRYPENGWALLGLSRALNAQGKSTEAGDVDARQKKAWARADVPIASSCLCVKAVAK